MALWSPDRCRCALNARARDLTGLSPGALQNKPALWIKRIHPEDRERFSDMCQKLAEGGKTSSCDYRFCVNDAGKEIWLREMSASHQNSGGQVECVSSAYMDMTDLKAPLAKNHEQQSPTHERIETCPPSCLPILDGLIHEIQNEFQVLGNSLYFLAQSVSGTRDYQTFVEGLQRVGKAMLEFREFLVPSGAQFSKVNLGVILEDAVQQMERTFQSQGIQLRMRDLSALPPVAVDARQLCNAIGRLLEFSRALLPRGGELEIEANLKMIDGKQFVKLDFVASSALPLEVEEKDAFEPFLRVNGHQVGLSILLADQILRRHNGKISFQKKNQNRALFTVMLEVY
jgi:PAS domain S-box-containing protein